MKGAGQIVCDDCYGVEYPHAPGMLSDMAKTPKGTYLPKPAPVAEKPAGVLTALTCEEMARLIGVASDRVRESSFELDAGLVCLRFKAHGQHSKMYDAAIERGRLETGSRVNGVPIGTDGECSGCLLFTRENYLAVVAGLRTPKPAPETKPVDRCERVGCDRPWNGRMWHLCNGCSDEWKALPGLDLDKWKAKGIAGKPKADPTPLPASSDPECSPGTLVPPEVVRLLAGFVPAAEWRGAVKHYPGNDRIDHERYGRDLIRIDGPDFGPAIDHGKNDDCAWYGFGRLNVRRSSYLAAMRAHAAEQAHPQTAQSKALDLWTVALGAPPRKTGETDEALRRRIQDYLMRPVTVSPYFMPLITDNKPEETAMSETKPEKTTADLLRALLDSNGATVPLSKIDRVEEGGRYFIETDGDDWAIRETDRIEAARLFALYQKETTMDKTDADKTPSLKDRAANFGSAVAYRTTAKQLTKRTRGIVADALTQHLKGKARATKRQMVLDLLDGPVGDPLMALLLSGVLPQVAGMLGQRGPKVERLAEELQLHAGVTVASDLVDGLFSLLGPAKEALTQALSGLPDVEALPEANGRCAVIDLETEKAKVR